MHRIKECILYRDFDQPEILLSITQIMEHIERGTIDKERDLMLFYDCLGRLAELAAAYGFSGNLWHDYLTFLLVNKENAFSVSCEITGRVDGSINTMALHDFVRFKELFDYDILVFDRIFDSKDTAAICNYHTAETGRQLFNDRIRRRIMSLSKKLAGAADAKAFMEEMTDFYKDFGVGKLGLHKAFRIERSEGEMGIVPITNIAHVRLDDLVGYEIAKKKLIDNTEAFLLGKKANNCLLFGDAGTGKSTCIKAILNQYYDKGLRIIEVYKHQFQDLNELIARIKNRNYKFIIYMDDLSFEEFEIEYKYLKAVIEGGLERKPDNILIYATSNRRHLIKEEAGDKEGLRQDMHTSDTVQEKLSLVYRFGVTIYFGAPDKKQFADIVTKLALRQGVTMNEDQLLAEANKWELSHGGLSGRTAQQFVNYLLGMQ